MTLWAMNTIKGCNQGMDEKLITFEAYHSCIYFIFSIVQLCFKDL